MAWSSSTSPGGIPICSSLTGAGSATFGAGSGALGDGSFFTLEAEAEAGSAFGAVAGFDAAFGGLGAGRVGLGGGLEPDAVAIGPMSRGAPFRGGPAGGVGFTDFPRKLIPKSGYTSLHRFRALSKALLKSSSVQAFPVRSSYMFCERVRIVLSNTCNMKDYFN